MSRLIPIVLAALLTACGGQSDDAAASREGREETRNIRNTESIGYSGGAIADRVDGALDAHDGRREQLDEAESHY